MHSFTLITSSDSIVFAGMMQVLEACALDKKEQSNRREQGCVLHLRPDFLEPTVSTLNGPLAACPRLGSLSSSTVLAFGVVRDLS